jgi:hypothetical protein
LGDDLLVHRTGSEEVHALNATAALLWEMCDGTHEPSTIAQALAERYGVEAGKARSDVDACLKRLQVKRLLVDDTDELSSGE